MSEHDAAARAAVRICPDVNATRLVTRFPHEERARIAAIIREEMERVHQAGVGRVMERVLAKSAASAWTTDTPTREGWYWWRPRPEQTPTVLLVERRDGRLVVVDDGIVARVVSPLRNASNLTNGESEWSGPLEPPA